ncbi:MAG TPA: glycoside hydrolase family 32 protein [Bryobacteraceae bacterium]|nr:glycoside hydrolase family 32 protein [Bryobacteraceae bacterium]
MNTRRRFIQASGAAISSGCLPGAEAGEESVIGKAMAAALAGIAVAAKDPERPDYHFHAPTNWINDPNGTIFYKGWHHLFYQFNPYGAMWGHMHWGHARSRDLVNWEHLPIAIGPSEEKGEGAIFSGAAMLARDGRPRIIYTSIAAGSPEHRPPEQWLAAPEDDDLIRWSKSPHNPVLTTAAHGSLKVDDWRDPFLFTDAGQTYMVCGGNTSGRRVGGSGVVELYRAANTEFTEWKHLGTVFEHHEREVFNIECPNLFRLGEKWVLIFSPHKPCEYFIGTLDLKRPRFIPEVHGILDAGNAYASNISVDDQGRTILWLWGRTENPESKGWNGVMVMPRILSIGPDGYLRQQPAREFEQLRGAAVAVAAMPLSEKRAVIPGVRGNRFELEVEVAPGRASVAGLELRRSEAGKAGVSVTISSDGILKVGDASTLVGRNDRYKVRVFLDKRVLEVYVNDGLAAIYYGVVNAGPEDVGVAAFARGAGARLAGGTMWPLKAAEFRLDRFRV